MDKLLLCYNLQSRWSNIALPHANILNETKQTIRIKTERECKKEAMKAACIHAECFELNKKITDNGKKLLCMQQYSSRNLINFPQINSIICDVHGRIWICWFFIRSFVGFFNRTLSSPISVDTSFKNCKCIYCEKENQRREESFDFMNWI